MSVLHYYYLWPSSVDASAKGVQQCACRLMTEAYRSRTLSFESFVRTAVADPEDRARGGEWVMGAVPPAGVQGAQPPPPEAGVLVHSV